MYPCRCSPYRLLTQCRARSGHGTLQTATAVATVTVFVMVIGLEMLGFHSPTFLLVVWHDTYLSAIRAATICGVDRCPDRVLLVRYFYDTEFIEDGRTIELISIAVVADDGREYYGVSTEFDPGRAGRWVRTHVLPKLPPPASPLWRSRSQIRTDLETFLGVDGDEPIELWAWVGAYDHVVLCQLWGPMPALPSAMPRFTRELRQLWEAAGCPPLPARPASTHDALVDAREQLRRFRVINADDRH